jgi:PilZ domain
MGQRLEWQEISQEVASDRRECKRLVMGLSITLTGVTLTGEPFSYKTKTTNISTHGCCFESDHPLEPGEIVAITVNARRWNGAHRFQIVWTEEDEGRWSVGASLVQSYNVWGVVFPPKHRLRKVIHSV